MERSCTGSFGRQTPRIPSTWTRGQTTKRVSSYSGECTCPSRPADWECAPQRRHRHRRSWPALVRRYLTSHRGRRRMTMVRRKATSPDSPA